MSKLTTSTKSPCPNCQSPLATITAYCPNCGQKQHTKKVSLLQLFADIIDNVFNVNGRIWRTFKVGLFEPGQLTQEYFQGRHQSYYHPIRFFIVSSIILFAVFGFKGQDFLDLDIVESKFWKKAERANYFEEFVIRLDSVITDIKVESNNKQVAVAFDTLLVRLPENNLDSVTVGQLRSGINISIEEDTINPNLSVKFEDIVISYKDLVRMNGEEIVEHYEIEGFWRQMMVRQSAKMIRKSGNFASFIWSNFPMMLLLMMPSVALLLKLLYIRRNRFFVEHLVFAFHTQAYFFLLYALFLLLDIEAAYFWFVLLLVANYLFFALKYYYGQGWGKTFMKLMLLGTGYFFVLLFAVLSTISISLFLF